MSRNKKKIIAINDDEMIIQKAYKFRSYPTQVQKDFFRQSMGNERFTYNYFSSLNLERQENGLKFFNNDEMDKLLTSLKGEKDFLKKSNSQSLQKVTKDVKRAIDTFFRRIKNKDSSNIKPFNFKKKSNSKESFSFPCNKNNIHFKHDYIIDKKSKNKGQFVYLTIPKMKTPLKVLKHRNWEGTIKNVTISRDIDDYYVSIQVESVIHKKEIKKDLNAYIGIDKGVVKLATLNNGQWFDPINTYKKHQIQLAKLQNKLSKKQDFNKSQKKKFNDLKKENEYFQSSNNYLNLQKKIAKLHRKIKRIRHEYLHHISKYLTKNYSYIMMEDLNTKNMTKSEIGTIDNPNPNRSQKKWLNRSILDQGWGILKEYTQYKSQWNNKILTLVNPRNTSKACSRCQHIADDNRESQSIFVCKSCGHQMHADVNAALNVLVNGLVKLNFSLDEIKSIINPWAKGELDKPIVLSKQQV